MTIIYSPVTGDILVYHDDMSGVAANGTEFEEYRSMSVWIVPGTVSLEDD